MEQDIAKEKQNLERSLRDGPQVLRKSLAIRHAQRQQFARLLGPQRGHRLNARASPCGDESCDRRHGSQDRSNHQKRHCIEWTDAEQYPHEQTPHYRRSQHAGNPDRVPRLFATVPPSGGFCR